MKSEAKVTLFLLLVLAALEVASRLVEPVLSADVRQMLALRELPARFADLRARGGSCFLVLGNSLARAAIDQGTLEEGLRRKGWPEPIVSYLSPDASGVNEWTAGYRKYFPKGGIQPDFVILVTGPGHLLDHPVRSPEKLGGYLAARGDLPDILLNWLPGIGEKARFLFASVSRLFANRERIRPLVFYRWVPGYEETAQRLNRHDLGEGRTEAAAATGSTLRFRELLGSIPLPSGRLVVVAAPLPDTYRIPGAVEKAASGAGIGLIGDGSTLGLPATAFPDGYHLGSRESVDFTARLVRDRSFDFHRDGAPSRHANQVP